MRIGVPKKNILDHGGDQRSSLYISIKLHIKELFQLSLPTIVSRMGILLIVTADTLMVGNYSSTELAYQAIGIAVIIPFLLGSLGLIMGTMVISSNAYGAKRFSECGAAWRRSIKYSLLLGAVGMTFGFFGDEVLILLGQTEDLAKGGGEVTFIIGLGLPANVLFLSTMLFLESIKRPIPGMVFMIAANILNIFLNEHLIYSEEFGEAMGAAGAAWATTVSRFFLCVGLTSYVWWMRDRDRYGIRIKHPRDVSAWRAQRRIGYASGVSIGIESSSFAILNIFAGWLGPASLASYTIAFNMFAIVFMIATGVGSATSVLVGIAYGRSNNRDIAVAGWVGLALNSIIMGLFGCLFYFYSQTLVSFYTNDNEVLALASPLVAFIAFILAVDGGQAIMSSALRGRRDIWVPSLMQGCSFLIVMVSVAYFFAFFEDHGILGLMKGAFVGATLSMIFHSARFQLLFLRRQIPNK